MTGTLQDAIEALSTEECVDILGIPKMHRRGFTYLLCPGHDDKNFGSCYIDKRRDDGYYCYVCGEHVAKWDMVAKVEGFDTETEKKKIANWFFENSGIEPTKEVQANPYSGILSLIRDLAPFVNNRPVHDDKRPCDKTESQYGRFMNGDYLYSEVVVANPLFELFKEDREMFGKIVNAQLDRHIKKYADVMVYCNKHRHDLVFVNEIGPVETNAYEDIFKGCEANVDKLLALKASVDEMSR